MAVLTVQFKVGEPRTEALVRLYDTINSNRDWLLARARRGRAHRQADGHRRRAHRHADAVDRRSRSAAPIELEQVAHAAEIELKRVPGTRDGDDHRRPADASCACCSSRAPARVRLTPQDVRNALHRAPTSRCRRAAWSTATAKSLVETGQFLASTHDVRRLVSASVGGPAGLSRGRGARWTTVRNCPRATSGIGTGVAGERQRARGEFPAVTIAVTKKPGENAVDVADASDARVEQLKGSVIPEGVRGHASRATTARPPTTRRRS